MPIRPTVFIGSSSEGQSIARAILVDLAKNCDVRLWLTIFRPSDFVLSTLIEHADACDFAILVLTPDDLVDSRGASTAAPRDNVLVEIGLFLGAIGRERTFIVVENSRPVKIPSDLAGLNLIYFQLQRDAFASVLRPTSLIQNEVERCGRRMKRERFALCIPRDAMDSDEFNRELKYHLMERLLHEGMRMDDQSSVISPSTDRTLSNFRTRLSELEKYSRERKACPRYLLIIWPEIVKDGEQGSVLASLRYFANAGCRIAAFNEWPDDLKSDPVLKSSVCRVHANAETGFEWLCDEIQTHLSPEGRMVLLVHASKDFQSARHRTARYRSRLGDLKIECEDIFLNSWDYAEARKKVRAKLDETGHLSWPFGVIAGANDNIAMGAADALDEYCEANCGVMGDKRLDTTVVGYDGLPSALRRIEKDGDRMVATLAASPLTIVETVFEALFYLREPDEHGEFSVTITRGALKTRESLRRERGRR